MDGGGFFRFEAGGKRGFLVVNTLGDLTQPGAKDLTADISPERCTALVSVSGYLIGSQAANAKPLPPAA